MLPALYFMVGQKLFKNFPAERRTVEPAINFSYTIKLTQIRGVAYRRGQGAGVAPVYGWVPSGPSF